MCKAVTGQLCLGKLHGLPKHKASPAAALDALPSQLRSVDLGGNDCSMSLQLGCQRLRVM